VIDFLKDLVQHTHALGIIDLVKITGDKNSTTIDALAEDRTVVISATTKNPVKEVSGTFGMPFLNKLDLHLKNPEYKEDAQVAVVWEERNGEDKPVSIHFENATGDFKNEYKLMGETLVNEKVKSTKFKGAVWQVEIEPSIVSIERMKLQAAVHSEENTFLVKTEGADLKVYFGDASTHEGSFVFQSGIKGKLKQAHQYPIKQFISILGLVGEKTIKFSDDGVILITIDSGISVYDYYILAQMK
jgi:hypothetical protein